MRHRRGPGRVAVSGGSMLPTYRPGDFLFVWYGARRLRVGDVVVVRRPERGGELDLKRIVRLDAVAVEVRGDNAAGSTDSRQFGALPRAAVVGRVVGRYWPPPWRRSSR